MTASERRSGRLVGAMRKGQYSIGVNDQFRLCFRWTTEGPIDIGIVDYHLRLLRHVQEWYGSCTSWRGAVGGFSETSWDERECFSQGIACADTSNQ